MSFSYSIIIPALNESKYLPALLDSIAKQQYKDPIEVIVVDGGSNDDTVKIALSYTPSMPNLTVLQGPRDIGAQRNMGAKQAKYQYLLFLDADVQLPNNLLSDLSTRTPTEPRFIIAVMHVFVGMSIIDRVYYYIGCLFLFAFLVAKMPVTNGDFMLTTRENFDKVGGFKEHVVLGEDIDFGKRSIASGATYKFMWRPKIIASLRRARTMGHTRTLFTWIPAFIRVAKKGPIYKNQGFDEYPFGHYK